MNRRLLLGVVALAAMLLLAGCTDFLGPRQIGEETLDEPAEYDWETSANGTITFQDDSDYQAVYDVTDEEFEVYQLDRLNNERHVPVESVRYRYPNGTVLNGSELSVETTRTGTIIELPQDDGQLAYSSSVRYKQFETPVLVEGSHEVVLPPNHEVENVLFGQANPGGYETERNGDRLHLYWADTPDGEITVHFYMQRDVYIFFGGLGVVALLAIGAAGYVYQQIRTLRRERDELGLNVEIEDDGDDPPPGMG